MTYKSLRNALIYRQGPGKVDFILTDKVRTAIASIDWSKERMEPVIDEQNGTVRFVVKGCRMKSRYPITYANFLGHIVLGCVGQVANLYTSPDEFFSGCKVQEDQHRMDGSTIKAGSDFESDSRRWVCLDYYGELDRSRLVCPWYYDEEEKCYQLMLHDGNSGLNKLRLNK